MDKDSKKITLTIRGDNMGEEITLQPDDLLYIHSADNYVKIFFKEEEQLRSVLFRATLKRMEEELAGYPFLFRCQKQYLLNFKQVKGLAGSPPNLELSINHSSNTIPVSRRCREQTFERLQLHAPAVYLNINRRLRAIDALFPPPEPFNSSIFNAEDNKSISTRKTFGK